MRNCKIILLSEKEQFLQRISNYDVDKGEGLKSDETPIKPIYIENCKFHKWVDFPYKVDVPHDENRYTVETVAVPHALVEVPNGTVDLIHYSKIIFTDE